MLARTQRLAGHGFFSRFSDIVAMCCVAAILTSGLTYSTSALASDKGKNGKSGDQTEGDGCVGNPGPPEPGIPTGLDGFIIHDPVSPNTENRDCRFTWDEPNNFGGPGVDGADYNVNVFRDGTEVATYTGVTARTVTPDCVDTGDYWFQVQAVNINQCGTTEGGWATMPVGDALIVQNEPPSAISLFTCSDCDQIAAGKHRDLDGIYTLSWGSADSNVAFYNILENGSPLVANFSAGLELALPLSGTAYADGIRAYQIEACNQFGCTNPRTIDFPVQVLKAPMAPDPLDVDESNGSIAVSWPGPPTGFTVDYYQYQYRLL